jgi:hypothetical protein
MGACRWCVCVWGGGPAGEACTHHHHHTYLRRLLAYGQNFIRFYELTAGGQGDGPPGSLGCKVRGSAGGAVLGPAPAPTFHASCLQPDAGRGEAFPTSPLSSFPSPLSP